MKSLYLSIGFAALVTMATTATISTISTTATTAKPLLAQPLPPAWLDTPCDAPRPYFAVTCFARSGFAKSSAPAVVAFNDTPNDDMSRHIPLATVGQVGSIYGLAYDRNRKLLYAGAYHKRLVDFGPGGVGAVYRIDLVSGAVSKLATLDAGPDRHRMAFRQDEPSGVWVGKSGLGDIDLDDTGTILFVMNLYDRRIYRINTATGVVLDSFPNGGNREAWSDKARPFGLGFHDGRLFHAVVDSQEDVYDHRSTGHIYRSRPDGSQMAEVARFDLDYPSARWPVWGWDSTAQGVMITDIEFRANGDLVLGLRNRVGDSRIDISFGYYGGDVLPARRTGNGYTVTTDPEFYQDNSSVHDESTWGGLASLTALDQVLTTAVAPIRIRSAGVLWLSNASGARAGAETIYDSPGNDNEEATFGKSEGLGDLEALCAAPRPSPTSTAAPTPVPVPVYLPLALRERPKIERQYADVVLILDTSSSMTPPKLAAAKDAARALVAELALPRDRVAIVSFNQEAQLVIGLTGDVRALDAAITTLTTAIGTRIDRGLLAATAELASDRRTPANQANFVLITDGRQGVVPEDAIAAAAAARQQGITVFAVGLGNDVDGPFLQSLAGDPTRYFFAPDETQLAAITRQVAHVIPCRPDDYWGRRCG